MDQGKESFHMRLFWTGVDFVFVARTFVRRPKDGSSGGASRHYSALVCVVQRSAGGAQRRVCVLV